jgi:branched-chain amino acid transport system permease protein
VCINAYIGTMSRSASGRVLRAIQNNETAAESLGKRASRFRLQAFVIGCMLMGPVGPLYVHFAAYIAHEDFLLILTFQCGRC